MVIHMKKSENPIMKELVILFGKKEKMKKNERYIISSVPMY